MPNMRLTKNPMPAQDPNVRNKNFEEVTLGYTQEMAIDEAQRCLHCKNKPCVTGCPVNIHIPEFIEKVAAGDFEAAYQVIQRGKMRRIVLPSDCGLMPMSEVWIARSIARQTEPSHGWIVKTRASVTETAASWLIGVGAP